MRAVDIAYAAGFFDGEGHVRCDLVKGYPHLHVSVAQNDPKPLDWLRTLFGGMVYSPRGRKHGSQAYNWIVNTSEAYKFLEVVLPFLMVKEADAKEAMDKWNERLTSSSVS